MTPPSTLADAPRRDQRREVARWRSGFAAALLALWGLAVAQPIFDLIGRTPEFLVLRGARPLDVVLLAVALVPLAPLALAAGVFLTGRLDNAVARWAAWSLTAGLGALLALPLLSRLPLPTLFAVGLAIVLGALLAQGRERVIAVGQWLSVLGALSLLLPVLFLAQVPFAALGGSQIELGEVELGTPRSVVLVIFDELPLVSLLAADGTVDRALFPRFAELAATSTWYPAATAVASITEQAVPAILTGRNPRAGLLPTLDAQPRNLFTMLARSHTFHVREPRTRLLPPELASPAGRARIEELGPRLASLGADLGVVYAHLVAPEPWRQHLPEISRGWQRFGRTEEARADEALEIQAFVEAIPPQGERPRLVVLHALLPHSPWIFLPDGARYPPSTGPLERRGFVVGRWADSDWTVIQAQQRHLAQLRYTDQLLGELTDRLRAVDLWDDALVAITADHGISFRKGGWIRDAAPENAADIAAVPLFVKFPGQATGAIDTRAARVTDIVPTVAEALGAALEDWDFEGRSLLAAPGGFRPVEVYNGPASQLRLETPLAPALAASVRRKAALFGGMGGRELGDGENRADGGDALFQIGPFRDAFWGHLVEDLEVRPGPPWTAEIDRPERYTEVDLDSGTLPARITGRWLGRGTGSGEEAAVLAVAVNGVIEALTVVAPSSAAPSPVEPPSSGSSSERPSSDGSFSALVRTAAWRDGANPLELFRVVLPSGDEGTKPFLEPVHLADPMRFSAASGELLASTGESWKIEALAAAQGRAWLLRDAGVRVEVVGWASHPRTGAAPTSFVVMSGGRFLLSGPLGLRRADLQQRYGLPGLENGGFAWRLAAADVDSGVEVYALFDDGLAGRLEVTEVQTESAAPEWG